jgi:hypothetical protein
VQLARRDAATFIELVLRDEQTGAPVVLAPMHERWLRAIDEHDRLALHAAVEHGKSSCLSIGRTLYELARDPSKRVCILSNTAAQARRLVRTIGEYIARSDELHQVAPHLRPGTVWREDAISVERTTMAKDASVTATGLHGSIVGSRFDLLIIDDLEDYESTRTESQRRTTLDWLLSSAFTRLTSHGRVVAVGTCWHREDVLSTLARRPEFASLRFPVVDPETGAPNWPERWPPERIERVRQQLGPFDAARSLDLQPISDESAVIKREWIDAALDRGHGVPLTKQLPNPGDGWKVTIGVDLGVSLSAKADETAIVAVVSDDRGRRQLLEAQSGRWPVDEICRRVVSAHRRFANATCVIESVAAQEFVVQLVKGFVGASSGKIIPFKTAGGKRSLDYQLELLGAEMAAGKWIIPSEHRCCAPAVGKLVTGLATYATGDHVPDLVAALLLARWGASSAGRIETFRWDPSKGFIA